MEEKRAFERIDAAMKIRYEIIGKPAVLKPTASEDISGTGIRLSLEERLDAGSSLKLQIGLPDDKDKMAAAYGEVVWVRKVEVSGPAGSSEYYETGIRFTRADPLIIGRIFKHFRKDSK